MVNRSSRDSLALALRRYVSGRITNDELNEVDVDWRDSGAVAVKNRAWCLYDDTYNHRATGKHRIDRVGRREISRWILFLHSDLEYIWPNYNFMQVEFPLVNWLTFGWWHRQRQKKFEEFCAAGDYSVWPFIERSDYDFALARPLFLAR